MMTLRDLEAASQRLEEHASEGSTVQQSGRAGGSAWHVVVLGVSGSGKSVVGERVAATLGWTYADGDDFHPPSNVAKMRAGTALTDDDRWPWLEASARWTAEHDRSGRSTVVACSALRRSYRDVLRSGGPTYVVHLDAPDDVLRGRVSGRDGHFMPPDLLPSQLAALERLEPDEPGATIDADRPLDDVVAGVLAAVRAGTGC